MEWIGRRIVVLSRTLLAGKRGGFWWGRGLAPRRSKAFHRLSRSSIDERNGPATSKNKDVIGANRQVASVSKSVH
jgi:hypothetical protein